MRLNMPRIEDLDDLKKLRNKSSNKSFVKKEYRPYVIDNESPSSDSQTVNNQLTNNNETIVNQSTNTHETFVNHFTTDSETVIKRINKQTYEPIVNQLTNELTNNIQDYQSILRAVKRLTGHQRTLLFYIVNNCIQRQENSTDPLTKDDLINATNINNGDVINTTIQRLAQKNFINRTDHKTGTGGYRIFIISDEVKKAVTEQQLHMLNNTKQLTNKLTNNIIPQLTNNYETVSQTENANNNNNLNKTIIINEQNELTEDWLAINYEPLAEIGFGLTQLKQLYKLNITTPEIVQDSIYQFAYTLKHNADALKNYPNKLAALMGTLRKGERWTESGYVHPKVLAARQLLEQQKKEQEELKNIENELLEMHFNKWVSSITEEEKKRMCPVIIKDLNDTRAVAHYKDYFKKNIYTGIKL